jgi:hypothetical protein
MLEKSRDIRGFFIGSQRLRSKMVMQWPAKPSTPVRFRPQPPEVQKTVTGNS